MYSVYLILNILNILNMEYLVLWDWQGGWSHTATPRRWQCTRSCFPRPSPASTPSPHRKPYNSGHPTHNNNELID